jgi:hypothetical protein
MYQYANWQDEFNERMWDSVTLFLGVANSLGVWLEPKAIFTGWVGLLGRAKGRMAPPQPDVASSDGTP